MDTTSSATAAMSFTCLDDATLLRLRGRLDFEIARRRRSPARTIPSPRLPKVLWVHVLDFECHSDLSRLESLRLVSVQWKDYVHDAASVPAVLELAGNIVCLRRRWARRNVLPLHAPALWRLGESNLPAHLREWFFCQRDEKAHSMLAGQTSRVKKESEVYGTRRGAAWAALAALDTSPSERDRLFLVLTNVIQRDCALCNNSNRLDDPRVRSEDGLTCSQCAEDAAARLRRRFTHDSFYALWEYWQDQGSRCRVEAVDALGNLGASASSALPMLIRLFKSTTWLDIRAKAACTRAIISIGASIPSSILDPHLDSVEAFAKETRGRRPGFRRDTRRILGAFGRSLQPDSGAGGLAPPSQT